MERLTRPNLNVDQDTDRFLHAVIGGKEIDWEQSRESTLNVLINGPTSNGFGKDIFRKMARDLYGRLKAYEDTGFEPEKVTVLGKLFGYALKESKTLTEQPTLLKHIHELAEADKDGRVVVLPCKVGDTVWRIVRDREPHITRDEVRDMYFVDDMTPCIELVGRRVTFTEKFGKTVFLSRAEAERALQEMEGKKEGRDE